MRNRVDRIHVLHVVPGLGPGGMELTMARVITGLTGARMQHSIACFQGAARIADRLPPTTGIHCMHSRPNEPQLPARLGRLMRRIRPNVIHARNWGAWPDTAVGRLLSWPVAPLIFSFHGLGVAGYMPLRRRLASGVLARITTHLLTLSGQSRQMLIRKWGWPAERVNVIPNGVDIERFHPMSLPRDTERIVIGTVGNLRPVKNHPLLIRACAALVRRGVDLQLRIAGKGDQGETLLSLAKSLKFSDRLVLAGPVIDVPNFLGHLDVFALTSDSEQHPNALNEAMASGVPAVATRVGCVEELLDGGRCGRIVEPGDERGLTDALAQMVADAGLRETFAAAGRGRACEHYSMNAMLAAYGRMYQSVARSRENFDEPSEQ